MSTTYVILYCEINLFAIALIGIIRYKTKGLSKMVAQRNFAMTIDCQMLFFVSDTLSVMLRSGVLPYDPKFVIILKELYFFATVLMCYFWFVYFEYLQDSPFVKNRKRVIISSFLVWIMVILLIVNLFTGILFYVDSNGVYQRGPLFIIQYALSYVYVFVSCIRALIGVFDKRKISKRDQLIVLALFPVGPAIAGLLQFKYPELPFACVALSLCTLIMYLNWLDQMISVDPLTRLNNRKQLKYYFDHSVPNPVEGVQQYLMIIDANKFKKINDTYGHIEGDAALVRIADALRSGCRKHRYRANIARYGGDEFVILANADSEEMLESLKTRIREELSRLNAESGVPYELTVSIGTTKVEHGQSLGALIAAADEEMYKEKQLGR
ncbi:MAG: diguanylate cyclase [Lachnospiraceae bacterium]|nr:diguanylate cyclase [Lachnospiraceae bacterium]